MVKWKLRTISDINSISNVNKVPKGVIKRAISIINVMCARCSEYSHTETCIECEDKALRVYPSDDEKGLVFEHVFCEKNTEEYNERIFANFELRRNSERKMSCYAVIVKSKLKISDETIETEILYNNEYTGANIGRFINSVFDEYYKSDCNNIIVVFRD